MLRALSGCACATLALSGCAAAGSSTVTVSGSTLKIYASAPGAGAGSQASDVLDAERLALQQSGAQVGRFTVQLVTVSGRPSDNARRAIQDKTAIAYLGEIAAGQSADSLGITNAQDVLQVTPADTAIALTRASGAIPGTPNIYYESLSTYGRTFARVVPTGAMEAKAHVQQMQALGVKRLYVAQDGSDYGRALGYAVRTDAAPAITVTSAASGADAVFYAGSTVAGAAVAFNRAVQSNPQIKLFGPSAIDEQALVSSLTGEGGGLYISAPGFLQKDLTSSGRAFFRQFAQTYGHAPSSAAIFGYEAMAAVLAVLREAAGSAGNRSTVVRDFFAIRNRQSVLGAYSIDSDGDISLAPFVFSRVSHGALVPYKFVQVSG